MTVESRRSRVRSRLEVRPVLVSSLLTSLLAFDSWLLTLDAQAPAARPLLARIGSYVEEYYARAQSILAVETVTLQPLAHDFAFDGFPRRLVYELRLEWDPEAREDGGPARVVRRIVTVNGRPPREGDEPRCIDPRPISPEPLAFLLPARREEYVFHPGPSRDVDGRAAAVFDFRSVRAEPPRVSWRDDCVSVELEGRSRGRIWADPETAAVLRLDEHLTGMVDIAVPVEQQRKGAPAYMTVERADSTIHYTPVTFDEPDETVFLPARIESLIVVRNAGSPRLRVTQSYTGYRRFVTDGRVVR